MRSNPNPVRNWCSQCGRCLTAEACGPTHALLWWEWSQWRGIYPRLNLGRRNAIPPFGNSRIDAATLRREKGLTVLIEKSGGLTVLLAKI